MNCENCKNKHQDPVSFTVHDKDMARLSAANRHLIIALIVTIIGFFLLAAGSVAVSVNLNNARIEALNAKIDAINELRELERSIETVYEYDIDQNADSNGRNYVVGGDFFGETAHQDQENNTP
jgi:hypothetical protein